MIDIENVIEIIVDIFTLKVFCKHEWQNSGWSYLRCKKCNARRYNPQKAGELIGNRCSRMIEAGHWDKEEVNNKLISKRIEV